MPQPDKELKAHDRRILLKSLRSETRPGGLKVSKTEENTIELTYEAHPLCQEAAKMIETQATEIAELQARIAELEARSVVKPLEWDVRSLGLGLMAKTPFGSYSIQKINLIEGPPYSCFGPIDETKERRNIGWFQTEAKAQSAAQADYERRILSALQSDTGDQT